MASNILFFCQVYKVSPFPLIFSLYRIPTMRFKAIFFPEEHFSCNLFKTIKIAEAWYSIFSTYLYFCIEIVDFNLLSAYIYIVYQTFLTFFSF